MSLVLKYPSHPARSCMEQHPIYTPCITNHGVLHWRGPWPPRTRGHSRPQYQTHADRFDRGQPHPIPIYYTPKLTHLYPHITARTYDEFPLCRCWARNLVIAGYRAARRASVSPQSRPREMGTGSDSTATHSLHIPCHLHLRRTDGSSSIAH